MTSDRPNGDWAGYTVSRRRGISQRYLDALVARINDGRTDGVIKRVWESRLHMFLADARTDPLRRPTTRPGRGIRQPAHPAGALRRLAGGHHQPLLRPPGRPDDQYIATAQGWPTTSPSSSPGTRPAPTIAGEPAPG
ncbi:hypothetical protein HBB16_00900 [Pseudonocardia sp. MCCB 268]|nr:hypothetical protein [Pseudonocardia cytotoxica]